jgi:hypothetical protein
VGAAVAVGAAGANVAVACACAAAAVVAVGSTADEVASGVVVAGVQAARALAATAREAAFTKERLEIFLSVIFLLLDIISRNMDVFACPPERWREC